MNYPSNSTKSKEKEATDRVKREPVVSGVTKTRKQNELQKAAKSFISTDLSSIGKYILGSVLIPNAKKVISDIVTNGINMMLYGENGYYKSSSSFPASKVSYNKMFTGGGPIQDYTKMKAANGLEYDDILFDNRGDAEVVLSALEDIINQFGKASVGDLYDLAQITTSNYMLDKYGWTDLHTAQIRVVNGGYVIKFPRVVALD